VRVGVAETAMGMARQSGQGAGRPRRPASSGGGWRAMLLVAVPFLLAGVAGLLQDEPVVAVPLLLVGAALVGWERLHAVAQGRGEVASEQAVDNQPQQEPVKAAKEKYHVLLSYSHQDGDWVEALAGRLEDEYGFRIWLDRWV
jgi:hypothetical protein